MWNRFLIWLGIIKETELTKFEEDCYCGEDDCPAPKKKEFDFKHSKRNGCQYEDWEFKYLKDLDLSDEEVAIKIERTPIAVQHKRNKMDLQCPEQI